MKSTTLFLLFTLTTNAIGSCQTGNEPEEEIDADFVWRICNEHDVYSMNNVIIYGFKEEKRDSLELKIIETEKCSSYFPGFYDGEVPPWWFSYDQNEDNHLVIYLEVYGVVRGLVDSTSIKETPGKYTYYTNYSSDRMTPGWVEIEREEFN